MTGKLTWLTVCVILKHVEHYQTSDCRDSSIFLVSESFHCLLFVQSNVKTWRKLWPHFTFETYSATYKLDVTTACVDIQPQPHALLALKCLNANIILLRPAVISSLSLLQSDMTMICFCLQIYFITQVHIKICAKKKI